MATVDFHYTEDEDYGGMGWIPIEQPKFNASTGFGVAHDTMEHFTLDGTVESEIMAFGSILYIRVETGVIHERNFSGRSAGEILAGDISGFFGRAWSEQSGSVLKAYEGRPRHLDSCLEHDLGEICHHTMRMIRTDMIYDYDETEWPNFNNANPDLVDRLKRWMRAGYWKCKARFKGASCHDLGDAYRQLAEQVNAIKYPDEGDRLRCTVQIKGGRPAVYVTHTNSWAL